MTLAQADQILDGGDDSSPPGCGWPKKSGPDRVNSCEGKNWPCGHNFDQCIEGVFRRKKFDKLVETVFTFF